MKRPFVAFVALTLVGACATPNVDFELAARDSVGYASEEEAVHAAEMVTGQFGPWQYRSYTVAKRILPNGVAEYFMYFVGQDPDEIK